MKAIIGNILMAGLLLYGGWANGGEGLSDSEATALVENSWKDSCLVLPLGDWEVLRADAVGYGGVTPSASKRQLHPKVYTALLEPCRRVGLIEIRENAEWEKHQSGGGFSWDNWLKQSVGGVGMKIQIVPTSKGKQIEGTSRIPKKEGFLHVPEGSFKVSQIIKNEERKLGTDTCRLVFATCDASWTPSVKEVYSLRGTPVSEKRKAKTLFKYDPFTSKWKFVTFDVANLEEEFTTTRVDNFLNGDGLIPGGSLAEDVSGLSSRGAATSSIAAQAGNAHSQPDNGIDQIQRLTAQFDFGPAFDVKIKDFSAGYDAVWAAVQQLLQPKKKKGLGALLQSSDKYLHEDKPNGDLLTDNRMAPKDNQNRTVNHVYCIHLERVSETATKVYLRLMVCTADPTTKMLKATDDKTLADQRADEFLLELGKILGRQP